jgi:hypothetical protein
VRRAAVTGGADRSGLACLERYQRPSLLSATPRGLSPGVARLRT